MYVARSGFANNKWQCTRNDFAFRCAAADAMLNAVKRKMEVADQRSQLKKFERK